jgi:hypothetical protein
LINYVTFYKKKLDVEQVLRGAGFRVSVVFYYFSPHPLVSSHLRRILAYPGRERPLPPIKTTSVGKATPADDPGASFMVKWVHQQKTESLGNVTFLT